MGRDLRHRRRTFERFADFSVAPEVRTPQTWQVPRAEFDELLLRHAEASGADVREGHRVLDVAFDGDGATVAFRDAADTPREVRVAAVVDASGRVGLLARKLDLRVDEPGLDNIAVFAHYSGVPRAEGRRAGDIRIVARDDLGWFWLIPISEALMSVGVVLPRAAYDALPRMAPRRCSSTRSRETPGVARLMRAARREWPVRVEKDFSFGARAYAGDRFWSWAMPAHSSTRSSRQAWPSRSNPEWRPGARSTPRSDPVTSRRAPSRPSIADSGSATGRSGASSSPSTRRAFASCSSRPCPRPDLPRLITSFAGYWRPSISTRAWQALFFVLVWLRNRVPGRIESRGGGRRPGAEAERRPRPRRHRANSLRGYVLARRQPAKRE